jgi:hypothetical protein
MILTIKSGGKVLYETDNEVEVQNAIRHLNLIQFQKTQMREKVARKKKNTIEVGSRVRLSPLSGYYSNNSPLLSPNPTDCEGVVFKIEDELLGVFVQWENGKQNSYDDCDLILLDSSTGPERSVAPKV